MKPLRWIIWPQSKSLKSGLCHCVCLKREKVLLCKRHATTLGAFKIRPVALLDSKTVCNQQPANGNVFVTCRG